MEFSVGKTASRHDFVFERLEAKILVDGDVQVFVKGGYLVLEDGHQHEKDSGFDKVAQAH